MTVRKKWFKNWKNNNPVVRHRVGFTNKFILEYTNENELEEINLISSKGGQSFLSRPQAISSGDCDGPFHQRIETSE